jgi:hypothetical protein
MTNSPSPGSTRLHSDSPAGHRHVPHPRSGRRGAARPGAARAPDLAAAAGEAVVRFLHDSSVAVAEREGSQPAAADAMPWSAASDGSHLNAESVALKAAAVSVSTLDRIELIAAKLEADIAAAHQAQADLSAGAGVAAAAAVRAAQAAWAAANTAVAADKSAKITLLRIARYVEATFALLVVMMIIFVVIATSVH